MLGLRGFERFEWVGGRGDLEVTRLWVERREGGVGEGGVRGRKG